MIIQAIKDQTINFEYLHIYPDQFVTEAQRRSPEFAKSTMDYFANKAYVQYFRNRETFVKNYDLIKGILRSEDFYEEPEVRSFVETLEKDLDLPKYVKHFSIMTTPLNNLVGEMTKRPDTYKFKAFDEDSKSEELRFRTELLQKFVIEGAKRRIFQQAEANGQTIDPEEVERMAFEQVKHEMDDYTSTAEKWANQMHTALKMEFSMKQKSEDGLRDLFVGSREFFHIYEDNSKIGFNTVLENPKNVWYLTTPDEQWISDPSGRAQGAYAVGTVKVMEMSRIIEECPDLTIEEINHLRDTLQDYALVGIRESNLFNGVKPGIDSITYDPYDPLVLQERILAESEMSGGNANNDNLHDLMGGANSISAFGYKYVVVKAYWYGKKKVGRVVYMEDGIEQSVLVDDSYIEGSHPQEVSVEWTWVNFLMQGMKIGPDVYHVKPFRLLNYLPIFGLLHEIKNTELRSKMDIMKPFQVIYNVCMNQAFSLLKKEIGNIAVINQRRIPGLKDGDEQDMKQMFELEARETGIAYEDDSPENTKTQVSNTSVAKNVNLERTNEISNRFNMAVMVKRECWELIGMTPQRMGSTSTSESATGVNTAVAQSYVQTEAWFVAHEYLLEQVYQGMIDAAQYIQSNNEETTLSFVNSEGKSAFLQVNGTDLKNRHLKIFPTNRPEDNQMFNEIRALAQPLMQNGGTMLDVIELYTNKSIRQMKKVFRDLHEEQKQMREREMAAREEEIAAKREQAAMMLQEQRQLEERRMLNDNLQKNLDRLNKKEVALINALRNNAGAAADTDNSGVADALEITRQNSEMASAQQTFNMQMRELALKQAELYENTRLKEEEIKVNRENQQNDLQIAKINARNRANKKTK